MPRLSMVIPWWDDCSECWCARRARRDGTSRPVADRWQELGFFHPPDFATAQAQHDELCRQLESAGAEVFHLPALPIFRSMRSTLTILPWLPITASSPCIPASRTAFRKRSATSNSAAALACRCWVKLSRREKLKPATWCGSIRNTLLIGQGYRTNTAGIAQMRALLEPHGVEVMSAPLPYGPGPSACLHLMSLMSLLDEQTVLVDLPWLAVETVELLQSRGYRFIEIEYSERDTLACNVLSLGEKRLLALEENRKTNQKLRQAGFDVRTFPGSELCVNGGGGPTCLTRPLCGPRRAGALTRLAERSSAIFPLHATNSRASLAAGRGVRAHV